jgi:hypothetical protein
MAWAPEERAAWRERNPERAREIEREARRRYRRSEKGRATRRRAYWNATPARRRNQHFRPKFHVPGPTKVALFSAGDGAS